MPRDVTFDEFTHALEGMTRDVVTDSISKMDESRKRVMAEARSKGLRIELKLTVRTLDNMVTLADDKNVREITRDRFVVNGD